MTPVPTGAAARTPRDARGERGVRGRRIVLSAVTVALIVTAVLAIGILLLGDFGETEGRILATTGLLALFGLLALPAGILFDQRRLAPLAGALVVLAAAGFALAATTVWLDESIEELEKSTGTAVAFGIAATQVAALAARRRARDPSFVGPLFAASTALALGLAAALAIAMWAEIDSQIFARLFAAGAVLDALLVALQPLLAAARRPGRPYRLRLRVDAGEPVDITVEAGKLATAAARAIDAAEQRGRRVIAVELVDEAATTREPPVRGPTASSPNGDRPGRRVHPHPRS